MRTLLIDGIAGLTYSVASSDTAASLAAAKLTDSDGRKMQSVIIENNAATGYGVRYGFGGYTPALGAPGTGHFLAAGSILEIVGYANCASFKFVNDVTGENALLYVTPKY